MPNALRLLLAVLAFTLAPGSHPLRAQTCVEEFSTADRQAHLALVREGFALRRFADLEPEHLRWILLPYADRPHSPRTDLEHQGWQGALCAARYLHWYRLAHGGPVSEELQRLADLVAPYRTRAPDIEANHRSFCAAAALEALLGSLPRDRRHEMKSRCSALHQDLVDFEGQVARALQAPAGETEPLQSFDPAAEQPTDRFNLLYARALRQAANEHITAVRWQGQWRDRQDCNSCALAVRAWANLGQTAAATTLLDEMAAHDDPLCRRGALVLRAWRQEWPALEAALAKLPDPPPPWADHLLLYQALQAAGRGTGLSPAGEAALARIVPRHPEGPLLALAAHSLARWGQLFAGHGEPNQAIDWLRQRVLQADLLPFGQRAFAVATTYLAAVADPETMRTFFDTVLRTTALRTDCPIQRRIALELLSAAFASADAERLQQARAMLLRIRAGCRDDLDETLALEVSLLVADWADRRLSGQDKPAHRKLKNDSANLLARLSGTVPDEVRDMAILNYLAAIRCSGTESVHDLERFLARIQGRPLPWILFRTILYLEQRELARAQAATRYCLRAAGNAEEEALCHAWAATIHELVSETAEARTHRERAAALWPALPTDGRCATLRPAGERKVRMRLDGEGMLRVQTTFSPLFYLVPMPKQSVSQVF